MTITLFSACADAALSATTINVIQGTRPYLSFDNGVTPELTTKKLLTITINNQDYDADTASSWNSPIQLPDGVTTIDKVVSYVTKTVGTTAMSADIIDIVKTNNLGYDRDGDQIVSGTGTVSISWKDFRGFALSGSSATLDPCFGPYQLTVSTTAATFTTEYGLPIDSAIAAPTNTSVTYYIAPPEPELKTCYAVPTSSEGSNTAGTGWNATYRWFNNVSTGSKFPTTGFDQATFMIRVVGSKNTPILAVASGANISGNIVPAASSTYPGNSSKITLTGTTFNGAVYNNLVVVPANFTVTVDSTPVYQFSINKWLLVASGTDTPISSGTRCDSLGTANGHGEVVNYYKRIERVDMTTSSASTTVTTRSIGGGAVAEWGGLEPYSGSGWANQYYWAGSVGMSRTPAASSNSGYYTSSYPNSSAGGVACVRK